MWESKMHSIEETKAAIWAAIQRPSPAITEEELLGLLRVAMDAPTADEVGDVKLDKGE